jgi:hypothetical protein
MVDIYPPPVQRPALLKLVEALGCQDRALCRDECGDWMVAGDDGHIYAVPGSLDRRKTEGFQIFVMGCQTVRQWTAVKAAMKPFTDVTNDGGIEGAFFLDRLPRPEEAEIIRRYVGVRKRREDSEATLAALNERTGKFRFQPRRPPSEGV